MARQGGLAGGLFAIFVPSTDGAIGTNGNTLSQNGGSDALSPHAVELTQAQRIVFSMMSLLLRIERESRGRILICRNARTRLSKLLSIDSPTDSAQIKRRVPF